MKTLIASLLMLYGLCTPLFALSPADMHLRDGNDSIIIDLPNHSQVIIVVNNLSQLREMGAFSVDSILAQVARQLDSQASYPGDTVMDFYLDEQSGVRTMQPKVLEHDGSQPNPCDAKNQPDLKLNLGLNFGGALIRNLLSPGMEAKITLDMGKGSIGTGLQAQYFFERKDDQWSTHLNAFATAHFGYDFSKNSRVRDRHEVTVGYLVRNRGTIFGENTFLLSYQKDRMRLRPILVFTNNFKSVFPGFALMF